MSVEVFEGNAETRKYIGDTPINLSTIEGWENLEDLQKVWLSKYFDLYPNQSLTTINSGVSSHKFSSWRNQKDFKEIKEFIEQLKTDELSAIHYNESKVNSKIRGQVLKAVKAKGYEANDKAPSQNLHIHGASGMSAALNAIKELNSTQQS
jgi:hypothetical protein